MKDHLWRSVGKKGGSHQPRARRFYPGSGATKTEAVVSSAGRPRYPGERGGQAVAETLSGRNIPAGCPLRSQPAPITFSTGIDQLPPFEEVPVASRICRHFKGKPLFASGQGLIYARLSYSNIVLSAKNLRAGDTSDGRSRDEERGRNCRGRGQRTLPGPPHSTVHQSWLGLASSAFTWLRARSGMSSSISTRGRYRRSIRTGCAT